MRAILLAILFLLPAALPAQDSRSVCCRFLGFGATGEDTSGIALSDQGAEVRQRPDPAGSRSA